VDILMSDDQPVEVHEDEDDEKEVGVKSSSSRKRLISAGVDEEEEEVTSLKKSKAEVRICTFSCVLFKQVKYIIVV
jgi:hypothetical protein